MIKAASTRMLIVAAIGAAAIFSAGCGNGDKNPVAKALGTESAQDDQRLRDWFVGVADLGHTYARLQRAFQEEDAAAARQEVDALMTDLTEAQDGVLDFDSGQVRRVLGDYVATFQDVATAADAIVTLMEEELSTGIATPDATVASALTKLQDAGRAAQQADRDLINRLSDRMSPEQRKRFNQFIREKTAELEAEAGAEP